MRTGSASLPMSFRPRLSVPVLVLVVVFVAFALRVYRLDAVGLEGDEAFSIQAAYSGFSDIVRLTSAVEPHPPLYYASLRVWYLLAGTSEFALRFPSLVANVLTVVFLVKVADFFSWRAAGILGAIFLSLNAYQVWYSQEARMYAPLSLLGIAAIYFALRLLREGRLLDLGLYAVFMLLTLYDHYYGVFLFVFTNLFAVAWMWRHRNRRAEFARWAGAQVVVVVLFLPWLAVAQHITLSYAAFVPGTVDLSGLVEESLVRYSLGLSMPADMAIVLSLGFLVVALAGVWFARRTDKGSPSWLRLAFISGYLFLPLALGLLVSLVRPMFAARYLMVSAPAFYLALGLGVSGLYRRAWFLGATVALFTLSTQLFSLNNYFHAPLYAKSDFREAATYIREHVRPGDAIILDGWSQTYQFWYYYTLRAGTQVPSYVFPPNEPDRWQSAAQSLDEIMAKHQGAWLLDYDVLAYDAQRVVETHLARSYYQALSRRIGVNRVVYYASAPAPAPDPIPLNVSFGGEVVAKGFSLDTRSPRPGDILHVTLSWQPTKEPLRDYAISWRLIDSQGHTVFQRDAQPGSDFYPSSRWTSGEVVTDRHGLAIPPFLLPGRYALTFLIYDKASGATLEPRQGDRVLPGNVVPLPSIDVLDAPPVPAIEGPNPAQKTSFAFEGLRLLGFDLDSGPFRPGATMTVKLYWEATDDVDQSEVVMRLLTDRGQVLQERTAPLGSAWFPSGRWPPGRAVASYVDVPVPARATTGSYGLTLSLRVDGQREYTFSSFPRIGVVSRERSFTVPSVSHPRVANFGGLIELLGYDLTPAPDESVGTGERLKLTLYWRAFREMGESYKVFTHLVGEDGRIYGQEDGIPLAGKAPTSGWAEGEIVTDQYDIAVRPDAPPGTYKLVLGLYEPAKGARLALSDGSGDSYVLADLVVSASQR